MTELKRLASLAGSFDIDCEVLSPEGVVAHHPMIDRDQVLGGLWIPGDGTTNPIDTTMAFAKGARMNRVRIIEHCAVEEIEVVAGQVRAVITDQGRIDCGKAVQCAGIWSRDLARKIGVNVPLYAAERMYVTTEPIAGLASGLPVIRDTDGYVYVKEDAGKLLFGAFEPQAKPLPMETLPERFEFSELQEDWDHFEMPMAKAMQIVPALEHAQIRHFMNGPESFTHGNNFILGEAPQVRDMFVAAEFNSQGILSAAGMGGAMADWIISAELDIARFQPFQGNRCDLRNRTGENLGLLYGMHWPHRQVENARPVRRSPLHGALQASGATAGWEPANWLAGPGETPACAYAWRRQNRLAAAGREHKAVRDADCTITRLAENRF